MLEILKETNPTARKNYDCMACEWVNGAWGDFDFSISELRAIVKARRNNYQVIKGQKYISQNNKFEGRIFTFKAIPAIHQICLDHDIYEC